MDSKRIVILLLMTATILYIIAHMLAPLFSMAKLIGVNLYFFDVRVEQILLDIIIYLATGLMFVSIIILLRNLT
jgi:hypothetical protein